MFFKIVNSQHLLFTLCQILIPRENMQQQKLTGFGFSFFKDKNIAKFIESKL